MNTIRKSVIALAATVALMLTVAIIAGTMLGPQPGRGLTEPQVLNGPL